MEIPRCVMKVWSGIRRPWKCWESTQVCDETECKRNNPGSDQKVPKTGNDQEVKRKYLVRCVMMVWRGIRRPWKCWESIQMCDETECKRNDPGSDQKVPKTGNDQEVNGKFLPRCAMKVWSGIRRPCKSWESTRVFDKTECKVIGND